MAGYVLANDVSEREWQAKRNGQWGKGKSFDGFGPIGPWLVTTDELADPQSVPLTLAVNGQTRQKSNTSDMIFPVARIVSYLSQFMTLLPGDLVITGYDKPAIAIDVVPNTARKAKVRTVISNSFGFGGQNTCLVLTAPPEAA